MKKLTRLLAPALLCIATAAAAQDDAQALIARIEGPKAVKDEESDGLDMHALMATLKVPGVSIAVVRDFKLHWAKAYGVADAASGRRVDTSTRFQSASLSKPVAALAAMRLAQSGRLDLDADIRRSLRSWQIPGAYGNGNPPVTARSLLSHTSGADDGFGFPGYAPGVPVPTAVQILDGVAPSNVGKVVFTRAPFTQYKYSGGGWVLLQLAMTDLAKQPFEQLMQSTVLRPLDMDNSSYATPDAQAPSRHALAHDEQGLRMDAPWHVYPEQAAASLWSTPTDLAKIIIELQTALRGPRGTLLDKRFATDMVTPVGVGPFGLGLRVGQRGQGWYFTHGGDNWGYKAWMIGHLRKGYGYVIMTNGDNGTALINPISDRIAEAYGWDSVKQPAGK